ncbi:MAG TPA: prolyl oligopeptidase family serine peptidase [Actinocrinis sp.]|nr:prolyl oligopeptidase family serine peptidase [Actinocrinis sp.]
MAALEYPPAERLDLVETLHGREVADPYRWLEDAGDPRTAAWEAAQDELLAAARKTWPATGRFAARLEELLAGGEVSVPAWRGPRRFFTRRLPGQEHAVLLTVDPDGAERILIDPMALDPTGTTVLDGWAPSVEGDRLGYLVSEAGTEESVLYVLDVASGRRVEGPITRTKFTPVAWLPGGEAFYYVRKLAPELVPADERQYHRRVLLHRVGTDPDADDVEIFGADQPMTNYHGASVTRDGRWLTVTTSQGTAPRNDLWIADLEASGPRRPRLLSVQVGVDAQVELAFGRRDTALAGRVLLFTDRDASRGRLCVADTRDIADTPDADSESGLDYTAWRDLIPEDPGAVLESYTILDGPRLERPLIAAAWSRHAVAELTLHDALTGERVGQVPLPGLGSLAGLSRRPEGGHELWFGYTDFTTPVAIHRYDALAGQSSLWAATPGAIEIPAVRTRQVTYTSADGTAVRMFVMDDGAHDGPRPAILYGYGGFNIPMQPGFNPRILAWVEAGGAYAVANLRGGSEEGEQWHRAGMMANKQNVYDDFHAAGDWLVEHGVTTRDRLGVHGGSNGGLLVGVALTQHPEKYAAVLCWAPLLDMVRYERFGLGVTWNEEYGSAGIPEQFGWLIGYSPYHHVEPGVDYPPTLFMVFDGDTRVDPLHARKLAAALQHATAGPVERRPVLYRMEREAGHGVRAVSRTIGAGAEMLGFLAAHLGLDAQAREGR